MKAQNKSVTVKGDPDDPDDVDTYSSPRWHPHCYKYNVFCSSVCPGLVGDTCKKGAHRCIVCDGDHPADLNKECQAALWDEALAGREYYESWRPEEEYDKSKIALFDYRSGYGIVTFTSLKNAEDAAVMAQKGTEVSKLTWVNRGDKQAPHGEPVGEYSPTYKNREVKKKNGEEKDDKEVWWPPVGPFYERSEFLRDEPNKNIGAPLCIDGAMIQVSKLQSKTSVYPLRCNTRY